MDRGSQMLDGFYTQILKLIQYSENGSMGVNELARALNMPVSTVYKYLTHRRAKAFGLERNRSKKWMWNGHFNPEESPPVAEPVAETADSKQLVKKAKKQFNYEAPRDNPELRSKIRKGTWGYERIDEIIHLEKPEVFRAVLTMDSPKALEQLTLINGLYDNYIAILQNRKIQIREIALAIINKAETGGK